MKRFYLRYESDERFGDGNDHLYGSACTVSTCKGYIRKIRKDEADKHPRNFRIYDSWAEVDPETGHVPWVYRED